jgi:hypothetical protein
MKKLYFLLMILMVSIKVINASTINVDVKLLDESRVNTITGASASVYLKDASGFVFKGLTKNGLLNISNLTVGQTYMFRVNYNSANYDFSILAGTNLPTVQTTKLSMRLTSCDSIITTGLNASVYTKGNAQSTDYLVGITSKGVKSIYLLPGTYDFQMDYRRGSERKSTVTVSGVTQNVDFLASYVQVPVNPSLLYRGLDTTSYFPWAGGYLLAGNYTFKNSAGQENVVGVNGCITSNRTATVRLIDSKGQGIAGGTVDFWNFTNTKYPSYTNNVATTNASGYAVVNLPAAPLAPYRDYVYFRMNYAGARQQLGYFDMSKSPAPVVTFQTVPVTLAFVDCNNKTISGGNAQYGVNTTFYAFGTVNSNGTVTKELLANTFGSSYYFRINSIVNQVGPIQLTAAQKIYIKDCKGGGSSLTPELGISEPVSSGIFEQFSIYPNPTNDFSLIEYNLKEPKEIEIEIYNMNGQLIQSQYRGMQSAGYYTQKFDFTNFSNGLYHMRIISGDQYKVYPILIQK